MFEDKNAAARRAAIGASLLAAWLAVGCGGMRGGTSASPGAAPSPSASKVGPGMDAAGNVVDPKLVEAGYGQSVKGQDNWQGEITGRPAPGSKFDQLTIGMPMKQVTDLIGPPTDQGGYMTGKAWIPFNFGADRHRYELVYKGQGRLIFAGPAGFQFGGGNLIWIIHSANEKGYR